MSYRNRLEEQLATHDVDVTLAKVGLVASILLLGLRLLADQVFLVVIPLAVGTACAIYLGTYDRHGLDRTDVAFPRLPANAAGYLPAIVVGGLALLVAVIRLTGGRSAPVLLLTGAIGAVLFAQILLVDDAAFSPNVVLFEILAAAVVIRLSALFSVPAFVGADIWVHGPIWINGIASSGSLEPLAESKYLLAPLYHVIGAVGALVTGSARSGLYLTLGLLVPLSALFVYGIGTLFVPVRWALFATALYAFADQFIRWGMHIIPTSLGLVFFLATLYCILKVLFTDVDGWVAAMLFVFSLAVVFTHQVSTAIALVALFVASAVAFGTDVIDGDGITRRSLVLVGATVVTLVASAVSWAMAPWDGAGADAQSDVFLFQILALTVEAFEGTGFLNLVSTQKDPVGGGPPDTLAAAAVPYVELLGFALLLAAAVIGGLVMLRWRRRPDATFTLLGIGGLLFVITFGFSLFGFRILMPGRWVAFLYVPLCVVAAVGLYYVAENAPRSVLVAVVLVVALGYPTTMVVAEKATLDDPAFEDRYHRVAFTESEVAASETIPMVLTPETTEQVRTDHPYWRMYHADRPGKLVKLVVNEQGTAMNNPVVYRSSQTTGGPSYQLEGGRPFRAVERPYEKEQICPADRNHVYANDDVVLCTSPSDEEVSDS